MKVEAHTLDDLRGELEEACRLMGGQNKFEKHIGAHRGTINAMIRGKMLVSTYVAAMLGYEIRRLAVRRGP